MSASNSTQSEFSDTGVPTSARVVELIIAVLVIALGIYVIWETRGIRVPPVQARVGPRVIPYLVGSGLVVLGVWLAIEVLSGRTAGPSEDAEDADASLPTDWRCIAFLGSALLIYLLLLERAGFVVASALLFLGAAFGMGSRKILRDAAIGIIMAFVVYRAFTHGFWVVDGLGLRLPAGWLEVVE